MAPRAGAVFRLRTAVDDARGGGNGVVDARGEPLADFGVHFLRLLRRGGLASADGPHGLVRNDHVGPLLSRQLLCERATAH